MAHDDEILQRMMANNRAWKAGIDKDDPDFFERMARHHAPRVLCRVPGLRPFDLGAFHDVLAQVALAAGEGDAHQWQREVGGAAQQVPGQDAEAAAVGRDGRLQRDFHREVGDAAHRFGKRDHPGMVRGAEGTLVDASQAPGGNQVLALSNH